MTDDLALRVKGRKSLGQFLLALGIAAYASRRSAALKACVAPYGGSANGNPTAVMTASWCRAALWKLRGELSTGRLVGWNSCQACGWIVDTEGIGWRSLDHLSFAPDADERIHLVSLHASRVSILIIMANSETEMIFTPRWYTVAQVAQLLNYGESKVRMLIITGQLRSIKDGRSRRILPEWVEAYVQDRAKSTEDIW